MDAQAMTQFFFMGHDLSPFVIGAGTWLTVGAFIGALHFLTLRWNVRMLAADRPLLPALVNQLARFTLTAGMLTVVADHFGAFPLLVAIAGVLAARTAVLRFG
jgi:F1F0 ATPase subunit 2